MAGIQTLSEDDLKRLRADFQNFMAKWKARGREVTTWTCPHCKKLNETRMPLESEVSDDEGFWSSATTCLECGVFSGVRVYPDGRIEVAAIVPSEYVD